jgi:hypothetical protein
MSTKRVATVAVLSLAALLCPNAWSATIKADFVFLIDASSSMTGEIGAVKAGLGDFVTGLGLASVDPRFAIILFGGAPELVLDFTSSGADTDTAFGKISTAGAVAGFQNNHNLNPEAGLEAIRIALGLAGDNTLVRSNVGGAGGLAFRADARKNLILVTDEDSDRPFYAGNRLPGQTGNEPPGTIAGTDWQTEVNNTASAVIAAKAFVNMLVNTGDAPSARQYGNPGSSVSDPDFLNFNRAATLAALDAAGLGNSLEAQILRADLIGRAFNITNVNQSNFINNFFAAKIEETRENPIVPEPSAMLLLGGGFAVLLAVKRRRKAY